MLFRALVGQGQPLQLNGLKVGGKAGPPTSHVHPRQTREQVPHFHSVQVYQGGGLFAEGGYQQEAGTSVLFEHCSAKGTSAVEDVDECFCIRVSSPR